MTMITAIKKISFFTRFDEKITNWRREECISKETSETSQKKEKKAKQWNIVVASVVDAVAVPRHLVN